MRLFLILLLLTVLPGTAAAHAWLKLRIATTEYAPYTSTDMEYNGYINHIIAKAFLETGVIVEFTSLPWDEALNATLEGKYDALSYGNYVRSREKEFWHSEPISAENLVLYVSKKTGMTEWRELSDLDNLQMGITKGYLFTDELAAYIENHDVKTYKDDKAAFEALFAGEINVLPIEELTGWYILNRQFSEAERREVTMLTPILSTVTTHLLIPKGRGDDRLVLSLFNKGLEQLQLEGEMKRFKRLLREGFYQHPGEQIQYDRR